ncbi:LacI family DNA-binding transcriptional regulator [Desertivibrio insolitus]|uniref:LacI family DNA-binding transcriptional regulator n=1 Tax=Herbiconiux sp. SYSU D00978 TaxID=2812562 RepID=UPI001F61B44B|nr:LacI family DNA-binding transcriptional regulator [Herbiconiux sp. SYSU D00978]
MSARVPTMRDVAARAGVGLKTVSRVINGEPNVSPAMIARVQQAAAELDFRPDFYASRLRRPGRRTHSLGLLVGSVANPFWGAIARAVEDVSAEHGTAVLIASVDEDPGREQPLVAEFVRRHVDGLVLTAVAESQEYVAAERGRGTQLVFVDRSPSGVDADAVVSDNEAGAAAAAAHLVRHGHRRIAYFGDDPLIWTARERRRGFVEELGRAGIPTAEVPVVESLRDEDTAKRAILEVLSQPDPPTALFTSQNLVTIGAIRALRELGLHREVALVGFDHVAMGDLLEPGITVVGQDPYRMGDVAARLVFARMAGDESAYERRVVPVRLIERGSGELPPRS